MSFNPDGWKLLTGLSVTLFGMFLIEASEKVLSGTRNRYPFLNLVINILRIFGENTQSCRMQIFSIKDMLLSRKQINIFDRAMDEKYHGR